MSTIVVLKRTRTPSFLTLGPRNNEKVRIQNRALQHFNVISRFYYHEYITLAKFSVQIF